MSDPLRSHAEVRARRAAIEADARTLVGLVRETWDTLRDPFGELMLLPRPGAGTTEPLPLGELPWEPILRLFDEREGRRPAEGARAEALRTL